MRAPFVRWAQPTQPPVARAHSTRWRGRRRASSAQRARFKTRAGQQAVELVKVDRSAKRGHRRRSLAPRARTQAQPTLHRQSSAVPVRPARAAQRAAPRLQHARRAASHPRLVPHFASNANTANIRITLVLRAVNIAEEGIIVSKAHQPQPVRFCHNRIVLSNSALFSHDSNCRFPSLLCSMPRRNSRCSIWAL